MENNNKYNSDEPGKGSGESNNSNNQTREEPKQKPNETQTSPTPEKPDRGSVKSNDWIIKK